MIVVGDYKVQASTNVHFVAKRLHNFTLAVTCIITAKSEKAVTAQYEDPKQCCTLS